MLIRNRLKQQRLSTAECRCRCNSVGTVTRNPSCLRGPQTGGWPQKGSTRILPPTTVLNRNSAYCDRTSTASHPSNLFSHASSIDRSLVANYLCTNAHAVPWLWTYGKSFRPFFVSLLAAVVSAPELRRPLPFYQNWKWWLHTALPLL